ncbi:hypothetical protein B0A55_09975 [Friedmanniomyces simplex]|uniref:Peptidase S8/S53 domain-containing protein n=1 Tax=Friedmanniomyces simplex TaxID=329884 RepID=A0A4U0WQW9_9PEZI|nr:hypothetical protein B0A55_09975 [Friedmanniomyces simplex]
MLFDGTRTASSPIDAEFAPAEGLIHWAPRIFTLGALLVSIMSNSPLLDHDDKWDWREGFNNQAFWCNQVMSNPAWPSLSIKSEVLRKTVREAVEACLSSQVFNQPGLAVAERKALLYKRVVWPLEYAVKIAGVQEKRALWMAKHPSTAALPSGRNTGALLQKSSSRSRNWVERLVSSRLNHEIKAFYKTNPTTSRTKIAILDTGYDPDSLFFSSSARKKRIKAWKDFVVGSAEQDIDGHGTHVLSTAMKIAPSADVYVARVAKNDADFTQSRERIVQAVRWAVNEMGVDIVSMSFGWPKEDKSRSISQAIEIVSTERDERILFFAAASNSGGDYAEWFPASHEFVTAVRATTAEGSFETFNAPPNFSGADVLGTLGVDVTGASRDPENPERSDSGTSFATPIAAAIGALVLDAAKIDARSSNGQLNDRTYETLRTRRGMRKMFCAESMSRKMNERSWYLSADSFCSSAEDARKTELDHAALHATYILPPNLTTHPGGSFAVGTIIADPFRPLKPLSVPPNPQHLEIDTHRESDRDIRQTSAHSLSGSVWAQFLQVANAKLSGRISSDLSESYTVKCLETVALREDPSDEYAALRASEPKVRAVMNAGMLGKQPVYLITGIKIARGFRWTREEGRSAHAQAGASVPIADQVAVGAEVGAERNKTYRDSGSTGEDIIFAYQLHTIADKGWRKKETTIAEPWVPKGGLLRKDKEDQEEEPVEALAATVDELQEFAEESEDTVKVVEVRDGDETCVCVYADL